MTALLLNPFVTYHDQLGYPLDQGYIYVGEVNKDPRQFPVDVYLDVAKTNLAIQPLRTINGTVNNGYKPIPIFTDAENYSVLVLDKNEVQVFYDKSSVTSNFGVTEALDYIQQVTDNAELTAQQKFNAIDEIIDQTEAVADQLAASQQARIDDMVNTGLVGAGSTDLLVALPTGRTQRDKNSELVSVIDYMTNTEYAAWKTSPTTADMTRPIQAFFNYIKINNVGTAYCAGKFAISAGLTLGAAGVCATKNIVGNFELLALNAIDTMLNLQCGYTTWQGIITITGTGSAAYNTRTCRVGALLAANCDRSTFTGFIASNFNQTGVSLKNKTTLTKIGFIKGTDCGSGYSVATCTGANWSNKVDSGAANSLAQRSQITVDVLPPSVTDTPIIVYINDQPYYIDAVDTANKTLTIFPWLDTTLTGGSLVYMFGGACSLAGGDASVVGVQSVDAIRCASAMQMGALYAPVVQRCTAQYCFTNIVLGLRFDSSLIGGQLDGIYSEACVAPLIKLTRATTSVNINSEYGFDLTTIKYACAPRGATNTLATLYANMMGISVFTVGAHKRYLKQPTDAAERIAAINCNIFESPNYCKTYKRNTANIALALPDAAANAAFGYDAGTLIIVGDGANRTPTSTITFTPPAGSTVNGGATAIFSNFKNAAVFYIYYDFVNANYIISLADFFQQASATYDPPSLATATQQSTTVTLTGAKLGDVVAVSFSRALVGTRMWAEVTAVDTVTVYHRNDTGATVDLASGTLKVKLI